MLPENSKRQNVADGESFPVDRISNLPDFVLSHILSFLPTTKESVKTSILSKRWRNVWTYVDKLVFDNPNCLVKDMMRYKRFVSTVIEAHKGNIKDFILRGTNQDRGRSELDVMQLINTAISRGVERLHVDVNFIKGGPKWPLSIFSCKTLVDLKMWDLYEVSLDVPSTPIFPCLKKLDVRDCDSGFFENIVARCSALEDLNVSVDGTSIHIVSASVKRLKLIYNTRTGDGRKIVLRAPSLQYLRFHCLLPLEFIVEGQLSSLNEAEIYFREYHCYSEKTNAKRTRDSFERFIQTMSNVKSLRLEFYDIKFFNSFAAGLFVNLTKLEIESAYFEWRLFLSFMESSINLEAITLTKNSFINRHKLAWKEPKKVPTCLSSSLKKLSMNGYSEDQLPMVKYVLRTAQVLEQVDIKSATCYRGRNDSNPNMIHKLKMLQNLQKLHKACERCEIVLV